MILLCIIYILIASVCVYWLNVLAIRARWDPEYDIPWPTISGILWPIAAHIAIAYIFARMGADEG